MAFIKAREIEEIYKNRGPERGSLHVAQVLAEQQRELGELINSMMDIIPGLVGVGERMKATIEGLNREVAHPDLGSSTQALSENDGQ